MEFGHTDIIEIAITTTTESLLSFKTEARLVLEKHLRNLLPAKLNDIEKRVETITKELDHIIKECMRSVEISNTGRWQLKVSSQVYCCMSRIYCPRQYINIPEQPMKNCDCKPLPDGKNYDKS